MYGRNIPRVLLPLAALCSISAPLAAVEKLRGSEGNDVLVGSIQDDEIFGEAGDDLLEGGDGNDTLYGGPGFDRLRGGGGADIFVFDFDATETDEILDFDPEEGDEIIIRLEPAITAKKANSVRFRSSKVEIKLGDSIADRVGISYDRDVEVRFDNDSIADRVRISYDGDVEVRFDNRDWTSLVKTGRSRLDLKMSHDGDRIRLRYFQKF